MNKPGLYVAGWLLAAGIATSVGFAAVAVVAEDVAPVGSRDAAVAAEDAKESVRTSKPTARDDDDRKPATPNRDRGNGGSGSSSSGDRGGSGGVDDEQSRPIRTQVTDGGTASARCTTESDAVLRSWSPRTGWSVLSADAGPSAEAVVAFTDDDEVITVRVLCVGVEPLFSVDVATVDPTGEPSVPPTKSPTASPSGSAAG